MYIMYEYYDNIFRTLYNRDMNGVGTTQFTKNKRKMLVFFRENLKKCKG